jgi:general secretion pathway protein C
MRPAILLRLTSVVLAVALVASLTDWVLTFSGRRTASLPLKSLPAGEVETRAQPVDPAAIARLMGTSASTAGNIRALGVMAEGKSGRGIALIGIDGQPARAVRAGETIAPGIVLAEVQRDSVVINRSGAMQQIRIVTKPLPQGLLRAP